jgi:predicted DNA-binding protein
MSERSAKRTVIQDYWYEVQHVQDLGQQWMHAAGDRLFILPNADTLLASGASIAQEQADAMAQALNKTGITQEQADAITTPRKVMLPLNKGGDHWTAITADVTIAPNNKRIVKLSFTDSLGTEENYNSLPREIKDEMSRIGSLFGRDATVTTELYPYTWKQPDGSSCGPYSFANATRCLDGKGYELNPGREAVRAQQLDMMTDEANIKACSTNNAVDEIIRTWIIDRASKNKSFLLDNEQNLIEMYERFAKITGKDVAEIAMVFANEDPRSLSYAQRRMNELIASDEIIEVGVGADKLAAVREEMQDKNSMQKFEDMRKAVERELGKAESYKFTANIIQHLSQMDVEGAELKINTLKDPKIKEHCLSIALDIISTRSTERDYVAKVEAQAMAYSALYEAEVETKKLAHKPQDHSNKSLAPQIENPILSKENSMQEFESMREKVEFLLGEAESYKFVAEVVQHLSKGDIEGAQLKITELEYPDIESNCLKIVEDITSEVGYAAKMETQASDYLAAYEARVEAEKPGHEPQGSNDKNLAPQTEDLVQVSDMLKEAISRNDAGLVLGAYYVIKDFTESIMSLVTGSTPSYKLISEVEEKLNLPPAVSDVTPQERKAFFEIELNEIKKKIDGANLSPRDHPSTTPPMSRPIRSDDKGMKR